VSAGSVETRDGAVGAFTEAVLAERFARETLAGRARWSKGLGWMAWDGRRWAPQTDEAVVESARRWALDALGEALRRLRTGQGDNETVKRWVSVGQTAGRLRSIVGLAKGIDGVLTDARAFDAHPDLLNVANGVVDLRTGVLREHDSELLLTRLAPARYRPGARHPDWEAALDGIPGECREWFQLRYGQAITGHMTPDDVLIMQQGSGENGKTTVTSGIARTLGNFYVLVSDRVLLAHPGDHPTELMELRGARLALIEETPEAHRLSVARLKKLVGTPQITARHIRQDSVTFEATHSLFLSTNYRPIVEETDHGTWRRLLLLRFPFRWRKPHEVLEAETDRRGDPGLRGRIEAGAQGQHEAVLAWLVDGAVCWYAMGKVMPEPPAVVLADTRAWRGESDVILSYADERLLFDPDAHAMSTELLADINEWLIARGQHTWSEKLFAARFGDHAEIAAHQVEKRFIRQRAGLSRRVAGNWSSGFPLQPPAAPAKYHAWLGLRFRTDADDDATPGNRDVSRVSRVIPIKPLEGPHVSSPNDPRHPRQATLDRATAVGSGDPATQLDDLLCAHDLDRRACAVCGAIEVGR
jgi:putative DNA primase/helicase